MAREGGGRFAAKVEPKEEGGLGGKGRRKFGAAGKRRQDEIGSLSPVRLGAADVAVREEESYAMDLDAEAFESSPAPMEQDAELESPGPFDDSDASSPLVAEAPLLAPEPPRSKQHPLATSYDATSAPSILSPPSAALRSTFTLASPPLTAQSPLASTSAPPLVPQSFLSSSGPFVEISVRGNGGRFLSKPEGESVKSRRRLAKAAALANPVPVPSAPQPMTVRAMRERDRKLREEREKEKEGVGQEHMKTKRLFVCEGCFKYMVQPVAHGAHQVRLRTGSSLLTYADAAGYSHRRSALSRTGVRREGRCISEAHTRSGRLTEQRPRYALERIDPRAALTLDHSCIVRTCASLRSFSSSTSICSSTCVVRHNLFVVLELMLSVLTQVEGFMFYVLTDARPSFDYVLGYFSKVSALRHRCGSF